MASLQTAAALGGGPYRIILNASTNNYPASNQSTVNVSAYIIKDGGTAYYAFNLNNSMYWYLGVSGYGEWAGYTNYDFRSPNNGAGATSGGTGTYTSSAVTHNSAGQASVSVRAYYSGPGPLTSGDTGWVGFGLDDYNRTANTPYYTNITRNSDPASFTLAYAPTGSVNGPTTYVLERATDAAMSIGYTTTNVSSVDPNTSYYFRMYAYGDEGGNKYSSVLGPYHGQPSQPGGSAATSTNTVNAVKIDWSSPSYTGAGILRYEVYRSGTSSAIYSGTNLTFTDTSLTRGQSYTYNVYAVSNTGGGTPSYSSPVRTVSATASGVPGAPSSISIASKVGRTLTINHTTDSNGFGNAVTEYRIQLSTDDGATWKGWNNTTKTFTANNTYNTTTSGTFTYQLLAPALTYKWRVQAVNNLGAGDYVTTSTGTFVGAGGKRWDGTSWNPTTVSKRFDGTNWVDLTIAKRFDGTNWVDLT